MINFKDKKLDKFHDWMKTKYWCIVGFNGMPYETKLPFIHTWLREEHSIDISIFYDAMTYTVDLVHPTIKVKGNDNYYTKLDRGSLADNTCCLKHEEALEQGVLEALKLVP